MQYLLICNFTYICKSAHVNGVLDGDDTCLLKSRLSWARHADFAEALHVFPKKAQVAAHNKFKQEKYKSATYIVRAEHFFSSEDRQASGELSMELIPEDDNVAGGLLEISVNTRVMLTRNIFTHKLDLSMVLSHTKNHLL